MPEERLAESVQHTPLLPGACITGQTELVFSVAGAGGGGLPCFFSSLTRERPEGGNASLTADYAAEPGSSPGARPAAAERPLGGRFAAITGQEVPPAARCGTSGGAGSAGAVSSAFPGNGCSGARQAAGASSPCSAAQLQARLSPLLRGSPEPFPKAKPRLSSTSDKAFRPAGVRAGNPSPLWGRAPQRSGPR